jgi:alpha-tubulin suppressor-like RCC1 family protein
MAQWKRFSGVWTMQSQMQAAGIQSWPNIYVGDYLFGFGNDGSGQLGDGSGTSSTKPILAAGSKGNWTSVSGGRSHAVGVGSDGTLWAWGGNSVGQLGNGTKDTKYIPTQIGLLTSWESAAAGVTATAAIRQTKSLWTFGNGATGLLGQGDQISRSSPVQVGFLTTWLSASVGQYFMSSVKTDGTLWAWGTGADGQLGQSSSVSRSSPVQVGAETTWSYVSNTTLSVCALKSDGTLWAWGVNSYGQLGQNNIVSRSSPVQIGSSTNWSAVSCGYLHVIALETSGKIWTWGSNSFGQLGQNTAISANRSSPVQVGALTTWLKIVAGGYHCLATKTDGTLWAWGYNADGQLGQGNTAYKSSPVQVPGVASSWSTTTAPAAGRDFSFGKVSNIIS